MQHSRGKQKINSPCFIEALSEQKHPNPPNFEGRISKLGDMKVKGFSSSQAINPE
jgi:hypothetical protein